MFFVHGQGAEDFDQGVVIHGLLVGQGPLGGRCDRSSLSSLLDGGVHGVVVLQGLHIVVPGGVHGQGGVPSAGIVTCLFSTVFVDSVSIRW